MINFPYYIKVFKILIKKPELDVNFLNTRGTALHLASKQGKFNYVKMLLELDVKKE